jgi:hypothetical protein
VQSHDEWAPVVDLIERVVGEDELLRSVVTGVRTTVREVGGLATADIAGHTRALLVAATRAIAARRGPTEAELAFVAELGVARARQGVPVDAVLGAIHVAERAIWSRAREVAAQDGVPAELLLDARELYDDWSEAVRARLICAHRATEVDWGLDAAHRDAALLRRLLEGGSAAALAAAEAGLPAGGGLWVTVTRPLAGGPEPARVAGPALVALLEGLVVAVVTRPSASVATAGASAAASAVGVAGPVEPEELGAARRLATTALVAAECVGRPGPVHVTDVPALAAIVDRADLAAVLLERHRPARGALGAHADGVATAVSAWLEADRDVTVAATALFVHPNTVRNRVQRFVEVTGIDPHSTFGGVDAWWLCRAWLAEGREPG